MRKAGFIIIGILVVLVILAAVVPRFIDVNYYRPQIQAELEKQLNRPVTLGDMQASLLPPSITINNAVIGENPAFQTGRPFGSAQKLYVSLQLLPLLRQDFVVNSVELVRPQVELVRNVQGVWNFSTLGSQNQNKQPSESQQNFSLGELKLTDGTVGVTDKQKRQPRGVYDHIDLSLKNFAPGKPFDLNLTAHLPGQGKQLATLEGHGGPLNQSNMANTPFDGKLTLQEVSLDGVQKFMNSAALEGTNATITGHAAVKNLNGALISSGSLDINNAVVQRHDIGYPIVVDYDVNNDLTNNFVKINRANIKLGGTPFAIAGTLNGKNTATLMDVKLNAGDVSIAELAKLAGAFGYAFNPDMQVAGH
jgi:uncharacterized protein involved in outer membrane biogenesis